MDQLIFASLSHTHYWYEVGILKVPAVYMHIPVMCDYISMLCVCTMYVCMVIITHIARVRINPGKVANPARGQLAEQGKLILPCPRSRLRIWSRETGSAVPSRVSQLISILRLVYVCVCIFSSHLF